MYRGLSDDHLALRFGITASEVVRLRAQALERLELIVGGGPVGEDELQRALGAIEVERSPVRRRRARGGLVGLVKAAATRSGLRRDAPRHGNQAAPEPRASQAPVPAPSARLPAPDPSSAPAPKIVALEAVEDPEEAPTAALLGRRLELGVLAAVLAAGALLRVWQINAVGLNSDEAVYVGQGASIAGVQELEPFFPTFRAHPLLFQTLVSLGFHLGSDPELFGRLAAVVYGLATVVVTWRLGRMLYGPRAGLLAAAVLALMPYHVIVTRQILLDGPLVFWSTLTLYFVARFAHTERWMWFYAAAAAMGLTFLSKESSVILIGAFYAFLALTPAIATRWRHYLGAGAVFAVVVSAFPLALMAAGKTGTGGNFLAWQLFRRPNHSFLFYPSVVTVAIGIAVVTAAALGLWVLRRRGSWRETLLLTWIAVPASFFQLFPIKGFQYLLPIAPALAVLAARFLAHWPDALPARGGPALLRRAWLAPALIGITIASLAVSSWRDVQPSRASTFLAGSGGVPGGREAGRWIARHVPEGARMMSVGPSMANILQFYGRRKVYGLSVSPNPLHRNPVYEAMRNPDRSIRDNELQYVVWDAFSADRTPFFSRRLLRYVERYNGRAAHSETVQVKTAEGRLTRKPVITIYEVRP